MKKYIIYILSSLLLISPILYGQEEGPVTDPQKMVNVLPPSPTAAELGKYGDIPIGLFTGAMEYTIPLYKLRTGHLDLPITLNYSSNGVKVDQVATNVGMSFSLNAGGVITRNIMGGDDFKKGALLTPPEGMNNGEAFNNPDQALIDYLENGSTWAGTQPDVFYFNFGGYTGKFVVDYAGKPVLIPYQKLKIEMSGNSSGHSFIITGPDGVKYFFEKIEWTTFVQYGFNCDNRWHDNTARRETAWYLTKIEHPAGDNITFQYENISYSYHTGVSQSISIPNAIGQGCHNAPIERIPTVVTCNLMSKVEGCLVKQISSSDGNKIVFNNTAREDISGNKKTSSIGIYTSTGGEDPIKTYFFGYLLSSSKERMFLASLSENNGAGEATKIHKFEYNDINSLPKRLSYAQDHFGYYNGATSNLDYFVPRIVGHFYFTNLNTDREPNGRYSTKGMLNKIVFPTGGYTEIMYESHKISHTEPNEVTKEVYDEAGTWGGTESNPAFGLATVEKTFVIPPRPPGALPTIRATVGIDAAFRDMDNPMDGPDPHSRVVQYELRNMTTNRVVTGTLISGEGGGSQISGTIPTSSRTRPDLNSLRYSCNLSFDTEYKITIRAEGNVTWGNMYVKGTYSTGEEEGEVEIIKDYGGARVSTTRTYDPVSGQIEKKNYIYDYLDKYKPEGTGRSGKVVTHYINFQTVEGRINCTDGNPAYPTTYTYDQLASSNILLSLGGNHVYYESVIESKGDDFANGGTEHHYLVGQDFRAATILSGPPIINAPVSNNAFMNGTEIYSRTFKKAGAEFKTLSETHKTYQVEDTKNAADVDGYFVVKRYPNFNESTPEQKLILYVAAYYQNISRWFYMNQERQVTYDDNGNTVTQTMDYYYDNPAHAIPTRIVKTASNGTKEAMLITYPLDYSNTGGFIGEMKNSHLVSYPIEQVKYQVENGSTRTIFSGSITRYKTGGTGLKEQELLLEATDPVALGSFKFSNRSSAGVLPPSGSKAAFGPDSRYKQRLVYNNYNTRGKLIEYTLTDGPVTSYLWNYSSQYPVAEIKNGARPHLAYTSFEGDSKGGWSYSGSTVTDGTAPTGKRIYALSEGRLQKSGLTNSKGYVVSYWRKGGSSGSVSVSGTEKTTTGRTYNGWTYEEKEVKGVSTVNVSGSIRIDEIRIQPIEAEMTTYTYDPLIGITSQADAHGNILYYKYDNFQRLKSVIDLNGKPVDDYEYHYQNQ